MLGRWTGCRRASALLVAVSLLVMLGCTRGPATPSGASPMRTPASTDTSQTLSRFGLDLSEPTTSGVRMIAMQPGGLVYQWLGPTSRTDITAGQWDSPAPGVVRFRAVSGAVATYRFSVAGDITSKSPSATLTLTWISGTPPKPGRIQPEIRRYRAPASDSWLTGTHGPMTLDGPAVP